MRINRVDLYKKSNNNNRINIKTYNSPAYLKSGKISCDNFYKYSPSFGGRDIDFKSKFYASLKGEEQYDTLSLKHHLDLFDTVKAKNIYTTNNNSFLGFTQEISLHDFAKTDLIKRKGKVPLYVNTYDSSKTGTISGAYQITAFDDSRIQNINDSETVTVYQSPKIGSISCNELEINTARPSEKEEGSNKGRIASVQQAKVKNIARVTQADIGSITAKELAAGADTTIKKANAQVTYLRNTVVDELTTSSLFARDNNTFGNIIIKNTPDSKVALKGNITLNGNIIFENEKGVVNALNNIDGTVPVIDKSKIKNGILNYDIEDSRGKLVLDADTITIKNEVKAEKLNASTVVLKDSSCAEKINAKEVVLEGNSKVKTITADKYVKLSDDSEVENIIIKGSDTPEIYMEGNAKVTGKIIFENSSGIVRLKRDENNKLPVIHADNVQNGTIQKTGKKLGFDKVAGMVGLKQTLKEDVIDPLLKPELYEKYGLKPINGILLYGPPGCGKTYICEALAEETGRYLVEITPSDVGSRYQHATAINIRDKFKDAIDHAPSMIFIDEMEAIAPTRSSLAPENPDYTEQVSEILRQINNCANKNVFVVGASNEPQRIDQAVKRTGRFDKKIFIGPPDAHSRKEMFQMYMENRYKEDNIDYDKLVNLSNCYVASDIKAVLDQAARNALRNNKPISTDDILDALKDIKPSVSEDDVEFYKSKIEE